MKNKFLLTLLMAMLLGSGLRLPMISWLVASLSTLQVPTPLK